MSGHITDAEVAQVQAYLDRLRPLLALHPWEVWVANEPTDSEDDNAIASVDPTEGRKHALVRIGAGWSDRSADEKRNALAHELLHLVHRDQTDIIRRGLSESGYLPQPTYVLLWETFRLATEVMVDHLAGVLSPYLPAWPAADGDDRDPTGPGAAG